MGFGGIFQANKSSFREIIFKNTLKGRKKHSIGNIKMLFILKKRKRKKRHCDTTIEEYMQ